MDVAIETRDLSKSYGRPGGWRRVTPEDRTVAISGVTLTVPAGERFGLLGANGAGKTTLVKILCTLVLPDAGWATVAGFDLSESNRIRQNVGLVVSDERSFYWRLTTRQNLVFFADMYNLPWAQAQDRINQVLERVGLLAEADRPFSVLSAGMRQRLAIARSLLHRPQLLFLDEPSRSLDPIATGHLHDLIRTLNGEERVTVFLITHDLAEAEALCQRVAIMHKGQIKVIGPPEQLRRRLVARTDYQIHIGALSAEADQALRRLIPKIQFESSDGSIRLSFSVAQGGEELTSVIDCLRAHRIQILSVGAQSPTLEQVFAYYSGQEAGES